MKATPPVFGSSGQSPPSKRTHKQRSRAVRDEIMSHSHRMTPTGGRVPGTKQMRCGPFLIVFTPPGGWGHGRGWNLQVWPGGNIDCGRMVHGDKVLNVDWDQADNIDILSFRPGGWDAELLSLLRGEGDILPFG